MYATKRKIKHLLDAATGSGSHGSLNKSATAAPTASTATAAEAPTTTTTTSTPARPTTTTTQGTPPKKRRLEGTGQYSPSTPSSVRPIVPSGTTLLTNATTTASKTPTYCPWDRTQFLKRLGTFRSVDLWSAKAEEINEVVWAKRGWECEGRERVRCVSCRRELVVRVEEDDDGLDMGGEGGEEENSGEKETVEELIKQYKELVVEGHDESCLWKKRGCDASIYHIPLAKPSVSVPAFVKRYKSLLPILSSVPTTLTSPLTTPPSLPAPDPDSTTPIDTNGLPHEPALISLALFGWECEDPSIPLLTCSACFRRLGLWLFNKKPAAEDAEIGEPDEDAVLNRLDVVGEHREYCPWVCKESQGGEEGWKTLEKVLHRCEKAGPSTPARKSLDGGDAGVGGKQGPEEKENLESRLKRLRTVYFGKGKKLKKEKPVKEKEKEKTKK